MFSKRLNSWLLSVALLLNLCLPTWAQNPNTSFICRMPGGITGFELEKDIGHAWVGNDTKSTNELKLYLTYNHGGIYLHSNLISPATITNKSGLSETNTIPTKIYTNENVSFRTLVDNIVGSDYDYNSTMRDTIVYVDENYYLRNKSDLDLSEIPNLFILRDGLSPFRVRHVKNRDGILEPIAPFEEDLPHVYAPVNAEGLLKSFKRFKEKSFPGKDYKVIHITANRDSRKQASRLLKSHLLATGKQTREGLEAQIKTHEGQFLFFVGHIENGFLGDRRGEFRIKVSELEALCQKYKVGYAVLGCGSFEFSSGPSVVKNLIHTSEVIPTLASALEAKTYKEFFSAFNEGGFGFYIGGDFFKGPGGPDAPGGGDPGAPGTRMNLAILREQNTGELAAGALLILGVAAYEQQPEPTSTLPHGDAMNATSNPDTTDKSQSGSEPESSKWPLYIGVGGVGLAAATWLSRRKNGSTR